MGAAYTIPVSGTVTSWSTNASIGNSQHLTFKVYRPLGAGRFQVVGHDGPRNLIPGALNTFKTTIPVQAGDLLGNDDEDAGVVNNACLFETGNPSDINMFVAGSASDGAVIQAEGFETEVRANEVATILAPPAFTSFTPPAGTFKGGTSVLLNGSEFAEVKSVTFGGVPAQFTVNSETQITAVTPPRKAPGKSSIAITTVSGTAAAAQVFSYEACTVPKLKGKSLKAAKRRLTKANCRLGHVAKQGGATVRSGEIVKQKPKPGTLLAPKAKVKVTLGS